MIVFFRKDGGKNEKNGSGSQRALAEMKIQLLQVEGLID